MKPKATIFLLITISWTFVASVTLATGDCSDFTDLTGLEMPISVSGTTEGASNDFHPFDAGSEEPDCWDGSWDWGCTMGPDVTYKWTAPADGWYAISLVGSVYWADLQLYDFTCPDEPVYPDDFICGSHAVIHDEGLVTDLWLEAGQELLIVIDGYFVAEGQYDLKIYDTNQLDDYLPFLMDAFHLPGLTAVVIRDGSPCWTGEYGSASLELANPSAVTDTTLFHTMCACKPITGTMLMQVWEDGLIELDGDANDYVPFELFHPDYPEIPITPRMLMCNVSGINDHWLDQLFFWGEDSQISLAEFMYNYFSPNGDYYNSNLNFTDEAPGTAYHYSNFGIALLGYLVECVRDPSTFLDHCEEEMFGPLDIYRSSFMLEDILAEEHLALEYRWVDNDWFPSAGHLHTPWYPSQDLRTSALEMSRFLMAIMRGGELDGRQIVAAATVDSMLTIQFPDIVIPEGPGGPAGHGQGLVWKLIDLDGHEAWGALGDGWDRACSAMFFSPEENNGAVFLANSGCGEGNTCSGGSFIIDALLDFAARPHGVCPVVQIRSMPQSVRLNPCYPNPFNPRTTVEYELSEETTVTLRIFDLAGRLVDVLVENETKPAGTHTAAWTGRDLQDRAMPSGTYFYRLEAGEFSQTKRMTLVK